MASSLEMAPSVSARSSPRLTFSRTYRWYWMSSKLASCGKARVTGGRNGRTLVCKDVPAEVCPNCGEDYVDEAVTRALLKSAEDRVASGAQVDIRTYASAA